MDLSALIFVALAGAWAVYLVPKALKAHEVDAQTRSIDDFSDRMRVLARREAVSADRAELVVEGEERTAKVSSDSDADLTASSGMSDAASSSSSASEEARTSSSASDEPCTSSSVSEARASAYRDARRAAAKMAASRRRRVLGLVLLALAGTVTAATLGRIGWVWVAVPAVVLIAWLAACRLMVKHERAARAPQRVKKKRRTLADEVLADEEAGAGSGEPGTEEFPAVAEELVEDGRWAPVPMTLPTYVDKEAAERTVRTIDLDATGVWSSGRNEADSELAREAEAAERATTSDERRAAGS